MTTGVDMPHVTYPGDVPALNDLVAGKIQLQFSGLGVSPDTDAAKKFEPAHGRRRDEFCAINTGAQWLTVSRISATSSTDRAVVDPVSCRLGA